MPSPSLCIVQRFKGGILTSEQVRSARRGGMWNPSLDRGSMVSSQGGKGRLLRRWPTQGLKEQMEGVRGRWRIQVQGLDGKTRSLVWMSTREFSTVGMRAWRKGQKNHGERAKSRQGLEPQQSLWMSQWRKTEGVQKPRGIDQNCFVRHSRPSLPVQLVQCGQQWSRDLRHTPRDIYLYGSSW